MRCRGCRATISAPTTAPTSTASGMIGKVRRGLRGTAGERRRRRESAVCTATPATVSPRAPTRRPSRGDPSRHRRPAARPTGHGERATGGVDPVAHPAQSCAGPALPGWRGPGGAAGPRQCGRVCGDARPLRSTAGGVPVAGLGDRTLRPGAAGGGLGRHQPEVGADRAAIEAVGNARTGACTPGGCRSTPAASGPWSPTPRSLASWPAGAGHSPSSTDRSDPPLPPSSIVSRRSSVSTSFVLAALRALHADTSHTPRSDRRDGGSGDHDARMSTRW